MNQGCWPVSESPFTHVHWPDDHPVGLVMDGVAIPGLGEQIYQWAGGQPFNAECLYVATRWEAVSDLSPGLYGSVGRKTRCWKGSWSRGRARAGVFADFSHKPCYLYPLDEVPPAGRNGAGLR